MTIVKDGTHLLLLEDAEYEAAARRVADLQVDVLEELPAGTLRCEGAVTSHTSTHPAGGLPESMDHPRMQVRHYTGTIHFYGQTLLTADTTVLPDSHRFYLHRNANHPRTRSWARRGRYVELPGAALPEVSLAGDYYLIDPQFTDHFGHIMTESIPRLWGWEAAKRRLPGLRLLAFSKKEDPRESVLNRLITSYGIGADEVVYVDTAVTLESVVTAHGMWHNFRPQFAHPDLPDVWSRIEAGLPPAVDAPSWDKVFVTRPPGGLRAVRNLGEVEDLFRENGFAIVRPEQYPLEAQAAIFRAATVVAGFSGSGMFNLMYAHQVEQVIVLSHESFSARNEHLYAALLGCRSDWFWSVPEERSFHSSWTFDMDRNRADLVDLLQSCN